MRHFQALRTGILATLLACTGLALSAQQRSSETTREVDPYTTGDAAVMAKAGYVSFGPFEFGTNHTSDDVAALLPTEPLLWIETAHFRIGCALPALPITGSKDREWVTKVRQELQQLSLRIPNLRPDTARLDPWLRVHLIAHRVETLYTTVQASLDCSDTDFPKSPGDDARQPDTFRGIGPFLGMPQKFTILLLQRSASLQRYTSAYHGWGTDKPSLHNDHRFGSLFFGACEESQGGVLGGDLAMGTFLAYYTTHNLYQGYRAYGHNLPAWLITGLAHQKARQVSVRFPIYDLRDGNNQDGRHYPQWDKRWPTMLRTKKFEPLNTFVERLDVDQFAMDEHLQSWALVDWLMTQHPRETMRFLHRMKDPFHERLRFPTNEELLRRQRLAMQEAFGTDAMGLEGQWRRMPLATVARR
jgi:hypothetical protein